MPETLTEQKLTEPKPQLTTEQIHSEEARLMGENPFNLVKHGFLTIKTKSSGMKKLYPNVIQKKFIDTVEKLFFSAKPVRILVLKARQMGISTVIEAIIYAFTSRMKGINSFVIADDLEGANYIFEMQKLYQEYLDKHLKPRPKHSNEKKLAFAGLNSQILIDTADNPNIGRKYTIQFSHLSECSRFSKPLPEILSGLGHAVPNSAGTMIFLETTANGYEDFYDLWTSAINGKSDWLPLFYAWHEFPEYSLPLENGKLYPIDNVKFSTPMEKENFLIDEKMIKEKYHLTDEQLNWRRWDLVNNCSGDINKFNEDNPSCWQDAFVATGNLYFNREALKRQEIKPPLAIGNIVKEEGRYIFRQDPAGVFKIYEIPKTALKYSLYQDEQYIVAGDPAEGLEHGDKSAGIVINKRTNKTACVYNHNIPPDRFADDLARMGHYYNEGIIACEYHGVGCSVNQDLYKHYGKVYRKIKTNKGFTEPTLNLGWDTNTHTRPQMLAQLAEEIAEGSTELLDMDLINQCWTFINNVKRGQPEAEKGKCDDMVMCYDEKTRVLTCEGWKYFKDVKENDLIPSLNIKKDEVENVKNLKTIISDYDGEMVHFDGKSIDLLVTPNHQVLASVSKGANQYKDFNLIQADKLLNKHFQFKKNAIWNGNSSNYYWKIPAYSNGGTKIIERNTKGQIVNCKGNQYKKEIKGISIKVFLTFLGFYISEGSGNKNRICIAQKPYSKGWDGIKKCCKDLKMSYREDINYGFIIQDTQFSSYIKNFIPGYCYEKRIPREILNLHPSLLQYLYESLMLGDGCDDRVYVTTSEGLKDDFMELINKLGWSGVFKVYDTRGRGGVIRERKIISKHLTYVISINRSCLTPRINHHNYGATVYKENYRGKIYCLSLEKNHILLVERNGRTCWSGNSRAIAGQVRLEQPYKEKVLITRKKKHFRGLSGY